MDSSMLHSQRLPHNSVLILKTFLLAGGCYGKSVPAKAVVLEGSRPDSVLRGILGELTDLQDRSGGAISVKEITLP
jgi:hypothetical protein